jgi:hypothetical protein
MLPDLLSHSFHDVAVGRAASHACSRAPVHAVNKCRKLPKSFSWLVSRRLPKAQTGAAAVFVDEFHAGVLEGASNDIKGGAPRLCHSKVSTIRASHAAHPSTSSSFIPGAAVRTETMSCSAAFN